MYTTYVVFGDKPGNGAKRISFIAFEAGMLLKTHDSRTKYANFPRPFRRKCAGFAIFERDYSGFAWFEANPEAIGTPSAQG
jgi:hypothetical protein